MLCYECDSECDYCRDFLCFEFHFVGIDSGCDFYKVFVCYMIKILNFLLIAKIIFVQNIINCGDTVQFRFKLVRDVLYAMYLFPVLNVENENVLPVSTVKFDHRNIRKILILCSFIVFIVVFFLLYYGNG